MTWEILLPIIAQEGLPVAELLFQKWSSGQRPQQADFDEARAAGRQRGVDRMKAALAAAGIPLDSDKAKEFIALAS